MSMLRIKLVERSLSAISIVFLLWVMTRIWEWKTVSLTRRLKSPMFVSSSAASTSLYPLPMGSSPLFVMTWAALGDARYLITE